MNLLADLRGLRSQIPLVLGAAPAELVRQLEELLGRGEVSMTLGNGAEIRESAYPGVWHVRETVAGVAHHSVVAAEAPLLVESFARHALRDLPLPTPNPLPPGVLTAPHVLAEITACLRESGERVVNLTNLPISPQDLACLEACLGEGPITGSSAGYGACRFAATMVRRVWRVRYFNADDKQLIDSLEVRDLPLAAQAQPEDVEDGLAGLARLLDSLDGAAHA